MKLTAVIFDLDGTVIDSRDQWTKAYQGVLKELGKDVQMSDLLVHGISVTDNWRMLLEKYKIKTDKNFEELRSLTYKYYLGFLHEVVLKDDVLNFIGDLKDSGIAVALATSSDWVAVEKVFNNLNLDETFDATVTGEETPNKKPSPDSLFIAADKLGVLPEECLYIGDTQTDIEAARAAGMKVVAIANDDKDHELLIKADLVIDSFSELNPRAIDSL